MVEKKHVSRLEAVIVNRELRNTSVEVTKRMQIGPTTQQHGLIVIMLLGIPEVKGNGRIRVCHDVRGDVFAVDIDRVSTTLIIIVLRGGDCNHVPKAIVQIRLGTSRHLIQAILVADCISAHAAVAVKPHL